MTRIGLLARANDRGLGIQTWEFFRALNPTTLVIDLGSSPEFPQFFDRYPGARVIQHRGKLHTNQLRRFFESVDVVYTAESTYDAVVPRIARQSGTNLVLHINPEFHLEHHRAQTWWAPTSWRLPLLPAGTKVVPVPVATDRFTPVDEHRGPCRWLHVAGKAALADRNGTAAVVEAIQHLTRPAVVTIATQDGASFPTPTNPLVEVRFAGASANYWDLYNGHDALVMPRRYGGLCLPVQEAMAAGMAVAMTDVSPNPQTWPIVAIRACKGTRHHMPAGRIEAAGVGPRDVARAMDSFADPDLRACHQAASRAWAVEHSWDVWADRYRDLLT